MKRLGNHWVLCRQPTPVGVLEIINDLSVYETSKGLFVHDLDNKRRYVVKELDPPQTMNGFLVKYTADFT